MCQREIIFSNESGVSFVMEIAQVAAAHQMLSRIPWEATVVKHAAALIIMGTMGQQHRHLQPPGGAANRIWKSIGLQVCLYNFFFYAQILFGQFLKLSNFFAFQSWTK